jgi:hypothetical protein
MTEMKKGGVSLSQIFLMIGLCCNRAAVNFNVRNTREGNSKEFQVKFSQLLQQKINYPDVRQRRGTVI